MLKSVSTQKALQPSTARTASLRHRRRSCAVKAAITIPETYSKVTVRGQNVLVKVAEAEKETKGGVLLPSQAQRKPTSGDVVNLGGDTTQLKEGDTVLYSKFGIGCTDIKLGEEDFVILREEDCIGVMPKSGAEADDVPDLVPILDRVLIKIEEAVTVTAGGMLIPDASNERPMCGEVIRTGPGKKGPDGELEKMPVTAGDRVIYFKYAGDVIPTASGARYTVVHASDILCKAA
uniref:20 kDa chaperonin, chloroplastic n=1 Tax=Tetraselmis sp. GSL018 TaxID=582737 RepID=A0A061S1Q5_9CHLO|mmetsp:Transcript_29099/g.69512  ORF Transcript_29099/g.69512 Transcript_29099/m.69512 type:complete len:234 (+) Transcript_29099:95-796(+)